MMFSRALGGLLLALFVVTQAVAESWRENAELGGAFKAAGVTGTFVLYDLDTDAYTVFDRERAQTRYIPASTFKIANSLIGLQVGAVADVDEVLPYGGAPQPFKDWEQDLPLREAIRVSSVPIYQELARRIGRPRMQTWVERLGYGNREIGSVVDRFWLDGPLRISAVEQVRFLAKLVRGELPVRDDVAAAVREITLLERTDVYVLHGKTGMVFTTKPNLGWWVGWVERDGSYYAFALNIDMPDWKQDLAKRVEIGRRCLALLGVL